MYHCVRLAAEVALTRPVSHPADRQGSSHTFPLPSSFAVKKLVNLLLEERRCSRACFADVELSGSLAFQSEKLIFFKFSNVKCF